MSRWDRFVEGTTRGLARRTGRRAFLTRLGGVLVGASRVGWGQVGAVSRSGVERFTFAVTRLLDELLDGFGGEEASEHECAVRVELRTTVRHPGVVADRMACRVDGG